MAPYQQLTDPAVVGSKWDPSIYPSRTQSYAESRSLDEKTGKRIDTIPRRHLPRYPTSSTASVPPTPLEKAATGFSTVPLEYGSQQPKPIGKVLSWWWWWEIGGAALSIVSLGLVVLVLFKINDRPASSWTLPIQPNSLIAVFTTVGKTAMLVPTAACISQLKWRHFRLRANRLHHLQLFDDASRGPWGAFMMLLGVRSRAITTYTLALVTILALGIEPSAQQILDFGDGTTRLANATAKIGIASAYTSENYVGTEHPAEITIFRRKARKTNDTRVQLTDLELALTSTVLGQPIRLPFDCPPPATECKWPTLTSLGVCGEARNITDQVTGQCVVGAGGSEWKCVWKFDEISGDCDFVKSLLLYPGLTNIFYTSELSDWCRRRDGEDAVSLPSLRLPLMDKPTDNEFGEEEVARELKAEVSYSSWSWCARTFDNIIATPLGITYGAVSEERLTWASLDGEDINVYRANSTGKEYRVSVAGMASMRLVMAELLTKTLTTGQGFEGSNTLDMGTFLFTTDPTIFTQNMAETLSTFVRTNDPGDNLNATAWEGEAFLHETYIRVRWEWLILPLVVAITATVLLVVSITLTWGQPLLKSSAIALLFHGLDGWSQQELAVPNPETIESLEAAAARLTARLGRNGQGSRGFLRSYE